MNSFVFLVFLVLLVVAIFAACLFRCRAIASRRRRQTVQSAPPQSANGIDSGAGVGVVFSGGYGASSNAFHPASMGGGGGNVSPGVSQPGQQYYGGNGAFVFTGQSIGPDGGSPQAQPGRVLLVNDSSSGAPPLPFTQFFPQAQFVDQPQQQQQQQQRQQPSSGAAAAGGGEHDYYSSNPYAPPQLQANGADGSTADELYGRAAYLSGAAALGQEVGHTVLPATPVMPQGGGSATWTPDRTGGNMSTHNAAQARGGSGGRCDGQKAHSSSGGVADGGHCEVIVFADQTDDKLDSDSHSGSHAGGTPTKKP